MLENQSDMEGQILRGFFWNCYSRVAPCTFQDKIARRVIVPLPPPLGQNPSFAPTTSGTNPTRSHGKTHYPWVIVDCLKSFDLSCSIVVHQVPSPDIVVVPGGLGTRHLIHDKPIIEWIRKVRHPCSWNLIIGIMIQQNLSCKILLVGQESDPREMTCHPRFSHGVYASAKRGFWPREGLTS